MVFQYSLDIPIYISPWQIQLLILSYCPQEIEMSFLQHPHPATGLQLASWWPSDPEKCDQQRYTSEFLMSFSAGWSSPVSCSAMLGLTSPVLCFSVASLQFPTSILSPHHSAPATCFSLWFYHHPQALPPSSCLLHSSCSHPASLRGAKAVSHPSVASFLQGLLSQTFSSVQLAFSDAWSWLTISASDSSLPASCKCWTQQLVALPATTCLIGLLPNPFSTRNI